MKNDDAPSSGEQLTAAIMWDDCGMPHSVLFDDKYFCRESGYEEALYVACHGNRLRERFSALDSLVTGTFTIIETGFGTGLDFCCAWQLWEECAPRSWSLNFVSLELYPLSAEQIARALDLWPCLSPHKEELAAVYKPVPDMGVYLLSEGRVRLTIVFDDVLRALRAISEQKLAPNGADAWFLDGFAPSKNPRMWSDGVFEGMARLSRPGTTLSTFTVAGFVRRGLSARGFEVQRVSGHGEKKNVLTGHFKKE
ncbi:MAG: tRNA (5-methylaminomethyl-2-thiouridine)(34)-methyltransferase MnmD [Candidatus Omnitrophica bacterium]|nr:tRNA (5-methylaminomethyl-2-thiouridine)(34)-methyltransferase MnmD [Candidatus Omnitrophota bacterium]